MELDNNMGFDLYDFTARQYDEQIGRFWGVDPASQFASGYTGMANDPANNVDPDGCQASVPGSGGVTSAPPITPVMFIDAPPDPQVKNGLVSFLDDKGIHIVGYADYISGQGSSPTSSGTAPNIEGVIQVCSSYAAQNAVPGHWIDNVPMDVPGTCSKWVSLEDINFGNGSFDNPVVDGVLSFSGAKYWWQNGNGQPVTVDFTKLYLGNITQRDFVPNHGKPISLPKTLLGADQFMVYGHITVVMDQNGYLTGQPDKFDWDYIDKSGFEQRNFETWLGHTFVIGEGTSYQINFKGGYYLPPESRYSCPIQEVGGNQ